MILHVPPERLFVLHQNLVGIGKFMPSTLEISSDFALGNSLGVGDDFPNISLILVEHDYKVHVCFIVLLLNIMLNGTKLRHEASPDF